MRAFIVFVMCFLFIGNIFAQQDSAKKTFFSFIQNEIKFRWTNDLNLQTGNVERFLYNTNLQIFYPDTIFNFEIKPRFIYGEIVQKVADERIRLVQEREQLLDLHIGVLSRKRLYGFAFGNFERSNIRKIDLRWVGGIGLGWHIVPIVNKQEKLNLTAAILREGTNFIPETVKDYEIIRLSLRFRGKHEIFKNKLRILHVTNVLPSIQFDENKRFNTNVIIEIPISKFVSLRGSFEYIYEGIKPSNVRKEDTRTLVGVVFTNM